MKNNFFNKPVANIYSKPSKNSEIVSQILYGEKFEIINNKKNWLKIKTKYDHYFGYIKKDSFIKKFKPTNKIYTLKSKIFKMIGRKFLPTKNFLYFGSGIEIRKKNKIFVEFGKNRWIKLKDTKKLNHYEREFSKILKLFINTKYLWGGKTNEGIDCSALIQIYFYYNRIFFPRDTIDQIKYCRGKKNKKLKMGDIIFWKGHVGVCIDKSNFIHAYGPRGKVLIMSTSSTINIISKTANLKVKKISNIKNY